MEFGNEMEIEENKEYLWLIVQLTLSTDELNLVAGCMQNDI